MKKIALTLIACMAFTSFAHAATSALTESLLEYEAITNALGTDPTFENVISQSEFIVDIKRETRRINVTGEVVYEIVTKEFDTEHHSRPRFHKYIAILTVTPNEGIGPNVVTVDSITPKHHHYEG